MTLEELKAELQLLHDVKAGRWNDEHDLRRLSSFTRRRWIGVAVTNKGTLEVRLTKRGETALCDGIDLVGPSWTPQ